MFFATTNKSKRLLHLNYIGDVNVKELQRGGRDMRALLVDLPADLRILADMERMESMDIACAEEIGKMMELLEQHGVELIVRLIPDPTKDIGFNIISRFHYRHNPRTVACKTMAEAVTLLSL